MTRGQSTPFVLQTIDIKNCLNGIDFSPTLSIDLSVTLPSHSCRVAGVYHTCQDKGVVAQQTTSSSQNHTTRQSIAHVTQAPGIEPSLFEVSACHCNTRPRLLESFLDICAELGTNGNNTIQT